MVRFLQTIFCDDIRQEVGGKLSLIGIYNGIMYLPQFPATLPKLWVMTTIVLPHDKPPKSIKARILKDSELLADLDATGDYLKKSANEPAPMVSLATGAQRALTLHAQICFAPFVLDGPCVLRVVATADEEEVRGLGLQILQQPNAAAA